MRSLWLLFLVGCSTGDGAILQLSMPGSTATATSVRVVLASIATDPVDDQHRALDDASGEPVVYLRQRALADAFMDVGSLDGFTLRLEPGATVSDRQFLPVVLAYRGDQLVAIGIQTDVNGEPVPIEIVAGSVAKHVIPMTAVVAGPAEGPLGAGQVIERTCPAATTEWPSGIAWRPATGPQLRLLYPDTSAPGGATDATDPPRPLDLDCDGHTAGAEDCDDLQPEVFAALPSAQLTCEMRERRCPARQPIEGACPDQPGGACTPQTLCDPSTALGDICFPDVACECAHSSAQCHACRVSWDPAAQTTAKLCNENVSPPFSFGCEETACTITVIASEDWDATIEDVSRPGVEMQTLLNVNGPILLHLSHSGGAVTQANSIGRVYLRVKQEAVLRGYAIDLQLTDPEIACIPGGQGHGPDPMACD